MTRKKKWFWLIYLLVLAGTVGFAFQQGRRFFRARSSPVPGATGDRPFNVLRRDAPLVRPGDAEAPAPRPATGPGEMIRDPLAPAALKPLDHDPGGIAPPEGAIRRSAFERRTGDQAEKFALYNWPGRLADAAEHYKAAFAEAGLKLLSDRTAEPRTRPRQPSSAPGTREGATRPAPSRRTLIFHAEKRHAIVSLRSDGSIVKIVLTVIGPDI